MVFLFSLSGHCGVSTGLGTDVMSEQHTHGFMLNRSLMLSGLAAAWLFPFSASSVQVICPSWPGVPAPPGGPVGEVGLVEVGVAFLLWINCTCLGRETATG